MSYVSLRKLDLPFVNTPVRGVGGDPLAKGAGGDMVSGTGALSPETQTLIQAGAIGGVMFYGVVLAIKGSLLAGGAAFIAGPMVVSYVLSKAMNY